MCAGVLVSPKARPTLSCALPPMFLAVPATRSSSMIRLQLIRYKVPGLWADGLGLTAYAGKATPPTALRFPQLWPHVRSFDDAELQCRRGARSN
jgi:hypothetical protein